MTTTIILFLFLFSFLWLRRLNPIMLLFASMFNTAYLVFSAYSTQHIPQHTIFCFPESTHKPGDGGVQKTVLMKYNEWKFRVQENLICLGSPCQYMSKNPSSRESL